MCLSFSPSDPLKIVFEWAGPKRRAQVHPILELGWVAGTILLPALFSVVRHFRYMQLMVFFYEILFVYWLWQTPESPSWLILKGRYQEAEDILTSAIIMNQKGTNADVKRKMGLLRKQILIDEKERIEESQKTLFDLWKSPILLKYCLVMYVISFSMFFVSYGTTYNAGEIVGSLYVTTLFGGFLSIIKHLMTYFIINKFNRKPFAMFFILASAASTLAMIPFALGDYSRWYRVPFGLLGKFLGTPGGTAIGLLQKEIFPTGMRQLASGSCSVAGRIGSIMAPFVRELNQATHVSVSLGLFAALGVCVGFLILLLPETKDKPLPDTLREAESRRWREAWVNSGGKHQMFKNRVHQVCTRTSSSCFWRIFFISRFCTQTVNSFILIIIFLLFLFVPIHSMFALKHLLSELSFTDYLPSFLPLLNYDVTQKRSETTYLWVLRMKSQNDEGKKRSEDYDVSKSLGYELFVWIT